MNFKDLDDLIHKSDVKEIVLDSDIFLSEGEESQYLGGIKLDVDDLVIDGNGYAIVAKGKTRIFQIIGKNITLKNVTLKNGFSRNNGGAIINGGRLKIIESNLDENMADGDGGAIFNRGELEIIKSTISQNLSNGGCGAISNIGGKSSLEESIFSANISNAPMGGCAAIHNFDSYCRICKCEFLNNKSSDTIVFNQFLSFGDEDFKGNQFSLQIHSSYFKDNQSKYIISNVSDESDLFIFRGEFADNVIGESFIFNNGKSCRIEGVDFSNCNDLIKIIINESDLALVSPKVNNDNFVFNEGHLILKDSSHDFLANISGRGSIETDDIGCVEKYNFRYLDRLIHSGADEIHLTSNIILDDSEVSEYEMGIDIDVDDIIIDGGGHTINGRGKARIFNCTANNVVIKNITLLNGLGFNAGAIENEGVLQISKSRLIHNKSSMDGAAIKNEGKLTINESILTENVSLNMHGGAINNSGELIISKSSINKNKAKFGGAIYNIGTISIDESILCENIAEMGAAIYNMDIRRFKLEGNVNIFNCEISKNKSLLNQTIISNNYFMEIHNTTFKENNAVHIISNGEDNSNLSVFNCIFKSNEGDAVVFNSGKYCYIEKSIFEKNSSNNIINQTELTFLNPKLKDESKTVFNEGYILIKNSPPDFLSKIYGEGNIEFSKSIIPEEVKFDFGYLDDKIHASGEKEIILDEDICFEDYETDFYEGGIDLEIDGLIIDGRGHIIDGGGKSRIFLSTGNDIILKNIIFKNGCIYKNPNNILNNDGGAIKIHESSILTIENCQFINNVSQVNAGAIQNDGVLKIIKSGFSENTADIAGAISNRGELKIIESGFCENRAGRKGGAISNDGGILSIEKSVVNNNISTGSFPVSGYGGAINNHKGELRISESSLKNNEAGYGAAINNEDAILNICKSIFDKNSANREGGAIYNNRGASDIRISTFNGNYSFSGGGAINNDNGELTLIESELIENNSGKGGAILLNGLTKFESDNCTFKDNKPDDVYEKE